ncbi:NAD(P)/FAD-dependent oxidoreductase [Halogeometricum sp. S1BR25-6]|uniref:NAD(P)/FAD-dependent oxidoreductase n=1 Tax=Halogeometricum salsisoli TaxID=2950536 RepID=A0ABU2GCN0_9EURY|nr:NAD(P)/FAD-dependent oxidoreductase [Halogeometricum sp. S1BR25-6]MDS0297893.1 NAD(P)/FAD-dependent oxidoreductase [Halogeometricum sp. S1BR25-6]
MSATEAPPERTEFDRDVVIVGGGPAGCSTGVFTARYGLDTVVFDRGRSSIQRCAFLENYLGFPAGIDVETLYDLMHDHAEKAGCEVVVDLVESVEPLDAGIGDEADEAEIGGEAGGDHRGFVVETQEGRTVTARRVVAATRYDGEYMRGLDDEDAMFETHEHDGEVREHFDKTYADEDGTTPVGGLYVATPYETGYQASMAAGRGARVGITVVEDARRERGVPEALADHYDWMRRERDLTEEWADRDRWREYIHDRLPDDHGLDEERLVEMREREIDRRFETYLTDDEVGQRTRRGHKRLLEHVDDDAILAAARRIENERSASEASD